MLTHSFQKLEQYIIKERYCGYDPFDTLTSPIFKLPFLKSKKYIRFVSQQLIKRANFNIRPLLRIKKQADPVTLALSVEAFTYLKSVFPDKEKYYESEIQYCLLQLHKKISQGYSGVCWGYYFDWEGRYARINSGIPTVVSTGIIINSLYNYYSFTKDEKIKNIIISAASFVMNDLKRTYEGDTFCFSYSPLDNQKVFNATMFGARLLAQVFSVTEEKKLIETAKETVAFVIKHQHEDGSWSYLADDSRRWIDNFHTAYILDCLYEYIKLSNDTDYKKNLDKGFEYYCKTFFEENEIPKYYNNEIYPIDCTSAGQSIITLLRFGKREIAEKVALWIINNMQGSKGYFYYHKGKYFTNKISYMRWSNTWMFNALSNLLYYKK